MADSYLVLFTLSKATITSGWRLGRAGVLRNLRYNPRAQSQGRHSIDRLEERAAVDNFSETPRQKNKTKQNKKQTKTHTPVNQTRTTPRNVT